MLFSIVIIVAADKSRSRPGSGKSRNSSNSLGPKKGVAPKGEEPLSLPAFPANYQMNGKLYDANSFAGHHVSDLVRENEELKAKVSRLGSCFIAHMVNFFISG